MRKGGGEGGRRCVVSGGCVCVCGGGGGGGREMCRVWGCVRENLSEVCTHQVPYPLPPQAVYHLPQ